MRDDEGDGAEEGWAGRRGQEALGPRYGQEGAGGPGWAGVGRRPWALQASPA